MSEPRLSFYIARTRTLLLIVFFCLSLFSLEIILWYTTDSLFSELNSLAKNNYEYSVVMKEPVGVNDYYQFNAAIRFSTMSDSDVALKVDVIMQTSSSKYNNDICWNTDLMNSDCIALTQNIAQANGIGVGDKLYSKHIVDGTVHEYTVCQVLPNIVNTRYKEDISHNTGVIVMGYDPLYEENITHDVIVFTNQHINDLTQNNSKPAIDMLYRYDEIVSVIKSILPYAILFVLLGIAVNIVFVVLLTKELSENFKRYVMLGYQPKTINMSYNRVVVFSGCFIELGIVILNIILGITHIICLPEVLVVISCNLLEALVIIVTACILKKKLWRS